MTTPEELWEQALVLASAATTEPQRRCAVSRIYYAIFHAVCRCLAFESGGEHSHQNLLHALRTAQGPANIKAAGRLDSLRRARVRADYRLEAVLTSDDLVSAQNHAVAVRQLLRIQTPTPAPPP